MKKLNHQLIENLISIYTLENSTIDTKKNDIIVKNYIRNSWPNLSNILDEICLDIATNFILEKSIIAEVVKRFSTIKEVYKIYYDQYDKTAEYHFYIVCPNDHYDEELFNRLLDVEYDLHNISEFREQYLSFEHRWADEYIPDIQVIYKRSK